MTKEMELSEQWVGSLCELLQERAWKLGTCESCTGGLVGDWITNFPGSSAFYLGGIQSYSNDLKHRLLGVSEGILNKDGAVSYACAAAMAEGGRRLIGADLCLSVTGIAGPGGGTPDKPVGLVYLGVSSSLGTAVRRCVWSGNRRENKHSSALGVLELAVHYLRNGGNI